MSIRKTELVNGEYYHIYNRGNSKKEIFHDDQDCGYFQKLLFIMNTEKRIAFRDVGVDVFKNVEKEKVVSIGAYCLMPNHFHVLIKQENEKGISIFMQKVSTAYVMYYNKKYKRTGSLFEGKFKSKYAGIDSYLKYLFSYIHLNPLKIVDSNWKKNKINSAKHMAFLENHKYSSFLDYFGVERDELQIINKEAFPDYFPTKGKFIKELSSWVCLSEFD